MTEDYFDVLQQPRRPWLEGQTLQEKFHQISSTVHPDRVHNEAEEVRSRAQQRYILLSSAFHCLRDPRLRLLHWLSLETGTAPARLQNVPADLMDFSLQVATRCREADGMVKQKAQVTSPLLQVQWFQAAQGLTTKLTAMQREVQARRERLYHDIIALDSVWATGKDNAQRESCLAQLESIARLLGFLDRWSEQLQERVVALAF